MKSKKVLLKHIDESNGKMERDKILDVVRSEPKQFQLVLYSIIKLCERRKSSQTTLGKNSGEKGDAIFTGDIYNYYEELCRKRKMEVLTQRRVSDIVQEFDMLGVINVRVISKGRGGRMREIRMAISNNIIDKAKEIIEESLNYG